MEGELDPTLSTINSDNQNADSLTKLEADRGSVQFIRNILVPIKKRIGASIIVGTLVLVGCGSPKQQEVLAATPTPDKVPVTPVTPTITPELALASFLNQEGLSSEMSQRLATFNNPQASPEDYAQAFATWNDRLAIFPYLTSREAKLRFVQEVLKIDDLDQKPYQTPNYGADVNGDGVVELIKKDGILYNEEGDVVNEASFVCANFAQEMTRRYGITREGTNIKPHKFGMPLFEAHTSEGYDGTTRYGRGHAFNGVYVGGPDANIYDGSNWIFFEPQSDRIVSTIGVTQDVIRYGAYDSPGTLLEISSPSMKTDFAETVPLITYAKIRNTNKVVTVKKRVADVVKKLSSWASLQYIIKLNPAMDDVTMDEQDFTGYNQTELNDAKQIAVDSGYLSPDLVDGAINDAKSPTSR